MKSIIIYEWHVFRTHFNMGSVPTELSLELNSVIFDVILTFDHLKLMVKKKNKTNGIKNIFQFCHYEGLIFKEGG